MRIFLYGDSVRTSELQKIQHEADEKSHVKLSFFLFAGLLILPGAVHAQQAPSSGDAVGLTAGDQIVVRFFDFPEFANQVPPPLWVRSDGAVHLPYVGDVKVAGLMPEGAERAIEEALRTKGIVKDPSVEVMVVSARNLTVRVIGEVKLPHSVQVLAPVPLSYVLEQAGGLTTSASMHLTVLHRGDQMPTSIEYDQYHPTVEAANTMLAPGDVLQVSSQGVFFVVGEVNRPGIYAMGGGLSLGMPTSTFGMGVVKQMTLLKALTQAGGVTAIAGRSHSVLLRTVDGKREALTVDLVKLEKGEIADPILHEDDILFVPSSYWRSQTNNLFGTVVSALYAIPAVKSF
jgi:polysaccharide export outer membrane protein